MDGLDDPTKVEEEEVMGEDLLDSLGSMFAYLGMICV